MPDVVGPILRWLHFLAGITWIGFLYYLNLVNVRMMASLDPSVRPVVIQANLRRVMAWFRHAAWVTVLVGIMLAYWLYWKGGDFATSDSAKTIAMGGLLGILMMLNVWGLIWPNQKKIIAAAQAGQAPDPKWGRTALYASRANFTMSFPMLLFMGGAVRFPMDWPMIFVTGIITAAIGFVVLFTVQKWAAPSF
ncbi:MAG: hypothetical protein QOF51_2210 [Chloroflexota bacterium]|jgi:uncharacterized membrane protein|nr:hypothetical protein [Chloroflexota bacterium]